MPSPYEGLTTDEQMLEKTRQLIRQHPLSIETVRDVAVTSWNALWQTRVGDKETAISITEIAVPSIVVAYFFERLVARELQIRCPNEWRGNKSKD